MALNRSIGSPVRHSADLKSRTSAVMRRLEALSWLGAVAREVLIPMVAGLALGGILLFARGLPSKWAQLVILATMIPTVVLLLNRTRKLVLVAMVVSIPLGLDVMLGGQEGYRGGPSGILISLMTVALVVGYALWLTDRRADGRPRRVYTHKDITLPALIFLFFSLVSVLQAVDARLSLTQLFLEIQFFLMYFYVINHVRTWDMVRLMFTTLVVCLLLESILMLLQYVFGFEFAAIGIESRTWASSISSATSRVSGTLGSPNGAATYLAVSLAITFAAYLTNNRLVNGKLALVAFLLGMGALVATQSRSGWAAFVVVLLILAVQALRRRTGVTAILVLCLVVVVIAALFSTQIVERLTSDDEGSAESRIWYNKLAFNIIDEHMWAGIGLNNLWLVMFDYLPVELMRMQRRYLSIIHNKYLLVWAEAGLFGLLSFLWLLFAGFLRGLRASVRAPGRYASIAITGLLAALVVAIGHMFSDPFSSTRMGYFWLVLAFIATVSQLAETTTEILPQRDLQLDQRPSDS